MKVQQFTIITDAGDLDNFPLDALFEAGCDDSSPASRDGVAFLGFDRKAETMASAIASAIRDVEAGLASAGSPDRVVRIDAEDYVTMSEEDSRAIERANAGLSAAHQAAANPARG